MGVFEERLGPERAKLKKLLDLGYYETIAYDKLRKIDRPLSAGELAKESGVPQSKIYTILRGLEKKKLVKWSTEVGPHYYRGKRAKLVSDKPIELTPEQKKVVSQLRKEGFYVRIKPKYKRYAEWQVAKRSVSALTPEDRVQELLVEMEKTRKELEKEFGKRKYKKKRRSAAKAWQKLKDVI